MLTLKEMFENDPQRLVDKQILFEFNEVAGKVKLINGTAAGGAWQEFEFVDGPFAGRKIYCADSGIDERSGDARTFQYVVHYDDDGFLFNKDPSKDLTNSQTEAGGGFYPAWDGTIFTIKNYTDGADKEVLVSLNAVLGAIFNNTPDNSHRDRLIQIIADDLAGNGHEAAATAIPELWERYKSLGKTT